MLLNFSTTFIVLNIVVLAKLLCVCVTLNGKDSYSGTIFGQKNFCRGDWGYFTEVPIGGIYNLYIYIQEEYTL